MADKALTLDTLAVSARPSVNLTELHANPGKMAELITAATTQMELAEYGHIQKVLNAAARDWKAPYYGTGAGIVKATLDPMIRHHVRISGGAPATIIGDIDMTSKLAEQTGFTHNGTMQQFSDSVILEQNNFERTYDSEMDDKLKSGTGVYGIFWDKDKLNGNGFLDDLMAAVKKLDKHVSNI